MRGDDTGCMSTSSLEQAQQAVLGAFGRAAADTVLSLNVIAQDAALSTSYAATALTELERKRLVAFGGGGWALTRHGRLRAAD